MDIQDIEPIDPLIAPGPTEFDTTIAVIIAARNASALIARCVKSLTKQLHDGDQVIVIDDGSTDATATLAQEYGATVIIAPQAIGPYAARNLGARSATASHLLFFDTRCRARDGLLDAHRQLLASGLVAYSYTEVRVSEGGSVASAAARARQPFAIANYATAKPRPYFPACNLGVSRQTFIKIEGFATHRSGGDADLCWRLQDETSAPPRVDTRALVEWEPRTQTSEYLSQFMRYGTSSARLQHKYQQALTPLRRIATIPLRSGKRCIEVLRSSGLAPSVLAVAVLSQLAFEFGYLHEAARLFIDNHRLQRSL